MWGIVLRKDVNILHENRYGIVELANHSPKLLLHLIDYYRDSITLAQMQLEIAPAVLVTWPCFHCINSVRAYVASDPSIAVKHAVKTAKTSTDVFFTFSCSDGEYLEKLVKALKGHGFREGVRNYEIYLGRAVHLYAYPVCTMGLDEPFKAPGVRVVAVEAPVKYEWTHRELWDVIYRVAEIGRLADAEVYVAVRPHIQDGREHILPITVPRLIIRGHGDQNLASIMYQMHHAPSLNKLYLDVDAARQLLRSIGDTVADQGLEIYVAEHVFQCTNDSCT